MNKSLVLAIAVFNIAASENEVLKKLWSCMPYPYDAQGTTDFAPCARAFTGFMAALNSPQADGLKKEFSKIEPVIAGTFRNYSGAHKSDALDLFNAIKNQVSNKK